MSHPTKVLEAARRIWDDLRIPDAPDRPNVAEDLSLLLAYLLRDELGAAQLFMLRKLHPDVFASGSESGDLRDDTGQQGDGDGARSVFKSRYAAGEHQ